MGKFPQFSICTNEKLYFSRNGTILQVPCLSNFSGLIPGPHYLSMSCTMYDEPTKSEMKLRERKSRYSIISKWIMIKTSHVSVICVINLLQNSNFKAYHTLFKITIYDFTKWHLVDRDIFAHKS